MERPEENNASALTRREDPAEGPPERPRDLDELLQWHQELALGPDYVRRYPEETRKLRRENFQFETQGLEAHFKWNQLVEYFPRNSPNTMASKRQIGGPTLRTLISLAQERTQYQPTTFRSEV